MPAAFGRQYLWLDLEALATGLLLPGEQLDRVNYFTARMRGLNGARHRPDVYLQALAARSTLRCSRPAAGPIRCVPPPTGCTSWAATSCTGRSCRAR